MALATQCPHCGTMFRVASDQLKLRGGIVRCGACQEIFDGSATLVDLDQLPAKGAAAPAAGTAPGTAPAITPAASPAMAPNEAAASSLAQPAATAPAPPLAAADELPFTIVEPEGASDAGAAPVPYRQPDPEDQTVYTLDFDHTFDPLGILPKVASADAGSDSAAAPHAAAETEQPADDGALDTPAGSALNAAPAAVSGNVGDSVSHLPPEEPEAVPTGEPATESEVDALALLQPWSRPPQERDATPQPSPVAGLPPPAVTGLPAAVQDEAPAAGTAGVAVEQAVQPAAASTPAETAPAARAGLAPDSIGRYEPAFGLPVDEELVAMPVRGHEPELAARPASASPSRQRADAPPLLTRESAASIHPPAASTPPPVMRTPAAKRADKAAARRSKLTPTKIEPQPKLRAAEIDEPEFVRRGRHQEQLGRTRKIAMLAGSAALLLVLVAQGAITFRSALAARFPATKPVLESSCALFGCRVELPAQVDNLAIETGELATLGGGAYSFATELRNGGGTAQAWPSLELTLLDANGKPLVRRVFAPTDYLAPGTVLANGMASGTEQPILLHFRVDDLKPSGYHIAVFYP